MCLFEANYECVVAEVEPEFTHNADSADISTSVFFFFSWGHSVIKLPHQNKPSICEVGWQAGHYLLF